MVQLTKQAFDTQVDNLFVNNLTNDIEADEVRQIFDDLSDSITFLAPPASAAIRSFLISGQDISVDPGTELSGVKTFLYNVTNSAEVVGNLTLTQDAATLSSAIDPLATSINLTITTITLAAGQSTVFTLSGTDTNSNPLSATFTVTARNLNEFVYFGVQPTNDATTFDFATQSQTPFVSGSQTITVPTFANDQYLVITQLASEPDLTGITIDGVNQFKAFTKTPNAFTVSSQNYDAWVSNNQLQGGIVSGEVILLER